MRPPEAPLTAIRQLAASGGRVVANAAWRYAPGVAGFLFPRERRRRLALAELGRRLHPGAATIDLAGAVGGMPLGIAEIEALSDRLDDGDASGAVRSLRHTEERASVVTPHRITLFSRAEAALRLTEQGFALPHLPRPSGASQAARVGLLFHSRAPLVPNGYAARSEEVIRAVGTQGWTAQAVTRLGYPRDINRFADAQVPSCEPYAGIPCHTLADPVGGLRNRPLDGYVAAYGDAVAEALADFAPSVLHAASNWQNGLAARHAAARSGAAVVYEARGLWELTALSRGDYDENDARFRLAARMEAEAAKAADSVIVLSPGLAGVLEERGVPRDKIVVAPNCAPVRPVPTATERAEARRMAGIPDGAVVVGYLGLIGAYEGMDTLVQAFARAASSARVPLHLLLVGDGPEADRVASLCDANGLDGRVSRLGRIDRELAETIALAVDIAPLPRADLPVTRIVPPIKAVEAMARGCAPIVSDLPALTGLVADGDTGLVVPPSDSEALATAIVRLADDEALRRRLGAKARRAAEDRFATDVVGALIISAYERALEAARER